MGSNPVSVVVAVVRGMVALVRFVLAVVELVRVPSTRHVVAVTLRGVAVFAPRAAWLFMLVPPRPGARR